FQVPQGYTEDFSDQIAPQFADRALREAGQHGLGNKVAENFAQTKADEGPEQSGSRGALLKHGGADHGPHPGVASAAPAGRQNRPEHHSPARAPNEFEKDHGSDA